ncbi:MAG: YeeE/YedE thiosulfate transporter family protein [Burkholderiaceae bacterium]
MILKRTGLSLLGLLGILTVTVLAGVQAGLLVLIGIGFGLALQGYGFGFAGGWRKFILQKDASGVVSHMLLIGLAALLSLPLLALYPEELVGAVAPLSWSLLIGAFVFGIAMQLADGCGSGSLHKAGTGNSYSWAVLPGFIAGSFWGASHQSAWLSLGGPFGAEPIDLLGRLGLYGGLVVTLILCLLVSLGFRWQAKKAAGRQGMETNGTWLSSSLVKAAVVVGILYAVHLMVAGQPWGIVYGLGLWGAKLAVGLGADLSQNAFWGAAPHAERIVEPVLWDITTLTNLGLLFGTMAAARWSAQSNEFIPLGLRTLVVGLLAGLVLGYSSRIAFGCNIGAFLGGAASASLHGWAWFAMAFLGSVLGVRLRAPLRVK